MKFVFVIFCLLSSGCAGGDPDRSRPQELSATALGESQLDPPRQACSDGDIGACERLGRLGPIFWDRGIGTDGRGATERIALMLRVADVQGARSHAAAECSKGDMAACRIAAGFDQKRLADGLSPGRKDYLASAWTDERGSTEAQCESGEIDRCWALYRHKRFMNDPAGIDALRDRLRGWAKDSCGSDPSTCDKLGLLTSTDAEACPLFRQACEAKNMYACAMTGECVERGWHGGERSSREYYRTACHAPPPKHGFTSAALGCFRLAHDEIDPINRGYLLWIACRRGIGSACYELAAYVDQSEELTAFGAACGAGDRKGCLQVECALKKGQLVQPTWYPQPRFASPCEQLEAGAGTDPVAPR